MRRYHVALFAIGLSIYGLLAWDRLTRPSAAPHFVYQAAAWLDGTIAIAPDCGPCGPHDVCDPAPPPCAPRQAPLPGDDWATIETVALDDGRVVAGRRMSRGMFWTLDGEQVATTRIRTSHGYTSYVSFPAFPSLLMIPSAAIAGRNGNDVIPTLLVAALILPLSFLLLRRLVEAGLSLRTVREDLWLVAMFAFGSVLFFTAVQGSVWYTAHVVGVALALVYAWGAIEARHPVICGFALGAAALTRTPMAFMFPLFVFEAWRIAARGDGTWRESLRAMRRPLLGFVLPVVVLAVLGMLYNHVRFDSPTEFGHSYLAVGNRAPVRQQQLIEHWGLTDYHYLSRNLAVAFALLPELLPDPPWIRISGHGLALWVTTPVLLLLIWPRDKGPLHRALWLTVLLVALPSLLYMNSGWFQFGYRFSLDYMVFFVMLLAIGGRPLGRLAKALIILGVLVNLFGAYTFHRKWQYYRVGGNAYDVVIPQ